MLSIANEIDPLIFYCIYFVCDTNMYLSYNYKDVKKFEMSKQLELLALLHFKAFMCVWCGWGINIVIFIFVIRKITNRINMFILLY